jgi:uncharacterized membrane protein
VKARLRQFMADITDAFWTVPALMVLAGIVLAFALVAVDRLELLPRSLVEERWLYDGGGTGARTLLGTITSSTIGVAGTVFSITIAALSLAAGQMGPRLLRNFTKDRGNQITLGVFLGTFSYALVVLRSVRTVEEGTFVPHLSLTVAMLLAVLCVGTLVYFVGHMSGRINVDTVIDLVSDDVRSAMDRFTLDEAPEAREDQPAWPQPAAVCDRRQGYLQQIDHAALADWAHEHGTVLRLTVRPGDYLFPGNAIAVLPAHVDGAGDAIFQATVTGGQRVSADDPEFTVRQLVEIGVRALSPGINDPNTAISVLDRLGGVLCGLAGKHLPNGVHRREGRVVLITPTFGYDGMLDAMFHMIRQNGGGSTAVLIRILEVLTAVAACERDGNRRDGIARHARLVLEDAQRKVENPSDFADVRDRFDRFEQMLASPPLGAVLDARA